MLELALNQVHIALGRRRPHRLQLAVDVQRAVSRHEASRAGLGQRFVFVKQGLHTLAAALDILQYGSVRAVAQRRVVRQHAKDAPHVQVFWRGARHADQVDVSVVKCVDTAHVELRRGIGMGMIVGHGHDHFAPQLRHICLGHAARRDLHLHPRLGPEPVQRATLAFVLGVPKRFRREISVKEARHVAVVRVCLGTRTEYLFDVVIDAFRVARLVSLAYVPRSSSLARSCFR